MSASEAKVDDKEWKALRKRVAELARAKRKVRVGVLGGDEKLVEIAGYHEYGAPRAGIPARSFLRSTLRDKSPEIVKMMDRLAKLVLIGKTDVDRALELLGHYVVTEVKKTITSHIAPPLQEETVRRKGSSTPLIDTSQLINAVTHRVE